MTDLANFREKIRFVLQQMDPADVPPPRLMSRWLYDKLKGVPLLKRWTEKWHDAKSFKSRFKTFNFLYKKLKETCRDHQLDLNAEQLRGALRKGPRVVNPPKGVPETKAPGMVNETKTRRGKGGKTRRKTKAGLTTARQAPPTLLLSEQTKAKAKAKAKARTRIKRQAQSVRPLLRTGRSPRRPQQHACSRSRRPRPVKRTLAVSHMTRLSCNSAETILCLPRRSPQDRRRKMGKPQNQDS